MYGHNFIINDIMDTAKKGDNAKYSNMSPEEAAFKAIHTDQYHGPLNPLFLSGLTVGMAQREPQIRASFPTPENSQPDNDVDWDFLGE